MYVVNDGHFEIFQKEADKWLQFFDLGRWRVYYFHDNVGEALAMFTLNLSGATASITLGKKWPIEPNLKNLSRSAFHEVAHVFLGRLDALANSRYITESECREAIHEVVRFLENKVFLLEFKEDKNE